MELHQCWQKVATFQSYGEWFLRVSYDVLRSDPWRACITQPNVGGERELRLWNAQTNTWDVYVTSKNLRALKAIGRIQAARRLHV